MKNLSIIVCFILFAAGSTVASELDGVWNLLFDFDTHPHQNNLILKVTGTEVTGRMWADDVYGTYENGKLALEFPYSFPYLPGMRGMARFDGELKDGILTGDYNVCGWQGPFRATKAIVAPLGGAYPIDGLWNCMISVSGGPHSVGTTTAMLFSFKQYGTEVTGRLLEDDVHGTHIDNRLHLEFPWTDPYFGYAEVFKIDAGYSAFDDVIFGTGTWGEDEYTISASRVPNHIVPVEKFPAGEKITKIENISEIDGVWNLLFDPDGHAHMNNLILKVSDTIVTGQMWEDQVHGTYKDGKLRLRFPYTSPYVPGSRGMALFEGEYKNGELSGSYEVGTWQGPFSATKAILGEPGGSSPLDGLWNCYVTVYSGPSAHGSTLPLLFNFKVDGTEITGRLWESDVKGTFEGNRITLDFPYADPFYPGQVKNLKLTAGYGAFDDLITGTYEWGEDRYTIIGTRVPVFVW